MNDDTQRISTGKLAAGMVLVAIGVAALVNARELWRYWPLLLIVIGLGQETDAVRTRRDSGGIFMIAVGVWMLCGSLRLFGLDYGESFPIGVMVVGLGLVLHAVLGISDKKENPREQQ
ncbi:MAG TPA: DUF5668 domain-containing protein [Thermoanaerobaculia bacterium]|nr:DUF5668 domain-containing protein [Thermoanaerobaculia bacterium]